MTTLHNRLASLSPSSFLSSPWLELAVQPASLARSEAAEHDLWSQSIERQVRLRRSTYAWAHTTSNEGPCGQLQRAVTGDCATEGDGPPSRKQNAHL
mmetsp:Transcript_45604/g.102345  ORF Transcript_45604/g.102345 Transcript_45604/m.102345 type:complete len:97 (+) Transcript_45604:146-436(+)